MVTADIAENDLTKMIEEFSIFERKKVSIGIKLTAIAMYLLSLSLNRFTLRCW
ncbi:MAG: hypothetical protein ACXQTD_09830 [Candidatus Syntropharchaeia archaeon]